MKALNISTGRDGNDSLIDWRTFLPFPPGMDESRSMISHSRLPAACRVSCAVPASPITFTSGIQRKNVLQILPENGVIICNQHIHCSTSESVVGRKDSAGGPNP